MILASQSPSLEGETSEDASSLEEEGWPVEISGLTQQFSRQDTAVTGKAVRREELKEILSWSPRSFYTRDEDQRNLKIKC